MLPFSLPAHLVEQFQVGRGRDGEVEGCGGYAHTLREEDGHLPLHTPKERRMIKAPISVAFVRPTMHACKQKLSIVLAYWSRLRGWLLKAASACYLSIRSKVSTDFMQIHQIVFWPGALILG